MAMSKSQIVSVLRQIANERPDLQSTLQEVIESIPGIDSRSKSIQTAFRAYLRENPGTKDPALMDVIAWISARGGVDYAEMLLERLTNIHNRLATFDEMDALEPVEVRPEFILGLKYLSDVGAKVEES